MPSPSPTEETPPHAGFSLPRDIIVNPARAFVKIAATREWIPAYAVIVLASIATTMLVAPALLHVAAITPPPPGQSAPHTPDAIAAARRGLMGELALRELMTPLLIVLLTASALTTVARFKAQTTSYITYVALAANCMIPSALGSLFSALIIRAHDPNTFTSLHALLVAVPTNLGVFANAANEREVAFLSHFELFDVWSYVLLAFGFTALTKIKFVTALSVAFGLDFLFAFIFG